MNLSILGLGGMLQAGMLRQDVHSSVHAACNFQASYS